MSIEWITVICNVLMAAVWLIYLQLFYRDLRRNNRPYMIIHHAQNSDPDSVCMFVNMGKEPIHVQCVVAYIESSEGLITRYITDYNRVTPQDQRSVAALREGPIQPGGYLALGSFREILLGEKSDDSSVAADVQDKTMRDYQKLQLCVAVTHGPSQHHIGVRRVFAIEHGKQRPQLRAFSIHTEQLVSRKKRKIVRHWVEDRLNPKCEGEEQNRQTPQEMET